MTKILITLLALATSATPTAEGKRWELTTFSGEVYVIGRGDTCNDAWMNHGPFPADWRTLECVDDTDL